MSITGIFKLIPSKEDWQVGDILQGEGANDMLHRITDMENKMTVYVSNQRFPIVGKYQKLEPIVVAPHGYIKLGSICIDVRDNTIFQVTDELENHWQDGIIQYEKSHCAWVAARGDDFVLEQVQSIVDGKLRNGEIVVIDFKNVCNLERGTCDCPQMDIDCQCSKRELVFTVPKPRWRP